MVGGGRLGKSGVRETAAAKESQVVGTGGVGHVVVVAVTDDPSDTPR